MFGMKTVGIVCCWHGSQQLQFHGFLGEMKLDFHKVAHFNLRPVVDDELIVVKCVSAWISNTSTDDGSQRNSAAIRPEAI